jgi:Notch-like protein
MLSVAFLKDYMSLPIRYYDFRHQAPLRYSRFLERWGTHYIKSASFGGKFSLLRESRVQGKETKTEWKERVQDDTSSMFEKKESSVEAKAKASIWTLSAEASLDTKKEQTKESSAKSAKDEAQANDKSKKSTSYSMDDIIVEGGSQRVAAILADKNRSGFKAEFTEWLDSIPEYPKGYNFRFGELAELLENWPNYSI